MAKARFRFACMRCSKQFRTQGGLAWHLQHTHADPKELEETNRLKEDVYLWFNIASRKRLLTTDQELQALRLAMSLDKSGLEELNRFLMRVVTDGKRR